MVIMVHPSRLSRMACGRGRVRRCQRTSPAVAMVPDAFRVRLRLLRAGVRACDGVGGVVGGDFNSVAVAEAGQETWFGGGGGGRSCVSERHCAGSGR